MKALTRALTALALLIAVACAVLALELWPQPVAPVLALHPAASIAPVQSPAPGRVAVNTASLEELMTLPGISRTIAQAMLDARAQSPFYYPEDLRNVPGIGEKRLELIRPHIRLD